MNVNSKNILCVGTTLSLVTGCALMKEEKPNIVYIVLDDLGYADIGSYGSSIKTPNLNTLAANGLQYVNYFTSPLSSPSRASLLTGSEANKIGMGSVSDFDLGSLVPNINGRIHPEYAPISHTLKSKGYRTLTTGKWHLGPYEEFTPDGDKYHWPSGKGFDNNYTFVGALANQFQPGGMIEGDKYIVPDTSDPDYHLTRDIFDKALGYIDNGDKSKPFFAYIGLGAMHGPFNVKKSYIDKYKGKFDQGWDVEREKILARQIELGIMPEGTKLAPRDESVPDWDTLTEKERAVSARHMETYAGYLDHTDEEIGRFINELKQRRQYDNTIFIVVSDNGANNNGGRIGSMMSHASDNLTNHDVDTQYALRDQFGSTLYGTQYNTGWGMSSNTPFKYFKMYAHYGGVKTAFIASWKNGIKDPGRLVHDMVAVFDITPTILDVIDVKPLLTVNGVKQEPMQGISFKESFESDQVMKNSRKTIALMVLKDRTYADGSGYIIVTHPKTLEWELYNIKDDPSQINNLAKQMPDKLDEMVTEYSTEVRKDFNNSENIIMDIIQKVDEQTMIARYGRIAEDLINTVENDITPTPEIAEYVRLLQFLTYKPNVPVYDSIGAIWYKSPESPLSKKEATYFKDDGIFLSVSVLNTGPVSHTITTEIEVPEDPQGVIYANGGLDGGYALYIKNKKLIYTYNFLGEQQKLISENEIEPGKYMVAVEYDKRSISSGNAILKVNGNIVASRKNMKTLPVVLSFDYWGIGSDVGSKVGDDYKNDYPFNGKVEFVRFNIGDDLLKF